jgi:hypothetical protein
MENFKTAVKKRVAVILEAGLFTARENPAVSMASTTQVMLAPLAEAHISSRPTSRSRSSDSEARSLSRDRSRSRDRARDRYRSPPRTKLDCSLCGRSNHSREQCYLKSHPQANHEDVPWRESKTGKRLRRLNYKTLPNRTALDASGRWVEWSRENHTPLRDSSRHNDNRTNADRESSYKPSRPIDNERGSDRESHRDPRRRDNLKDRDVSFTTDAFNATLNLAINASFPYNSVAPRPILSGTQRGARIKDSCVTLCDCGALRANFITRTLAEKLKLGIKKFRSPLGVKTADNKTIHLLNFVSLNVDLQLPNSFKQSCKLPESMTNSRIDNVRLIAIVLDSSP